MLTTEERTKLAERLKTKYALDDNINEIEKRIDKAVVNEQPVFTIDPDDQLTILGIMSAYSIYANLTPIILECLSAWLEDPDPDIFNMFDDISKGTNYTSGSELLYYAKGNGQ